MFTFGGMMGRVSVCILVITALVLMPVNVRAQADDAQLIKDVAWEAARSLGWGDAVKEQTSDGDTIVLVNSACIQSDYIHIKARPLDSPSIWINQTTTFHGYPADDSDTYGSFSWLMGRFFLRVDGTSDEPACNDTMEIAEALYAAAVAHNLGMESPAGLTPSPTPPAEYVLQGTVTDGHGNPVRYATVRLTFGVHEQATATDANGRYQFTGLPSGAVAGFNPAEDAYRVTVQLQYAPEGGAPLYRVLYGSENGPLVAPVSKAFSLEGTKGAFKYDVDFGNQSQFQLNLLEKVDKQLPGRLADLATIYVHTSEAIDLADQLGQEISRPFNVIAFGKGQSGACWYGRNSNGTQDWNKCLNLSNKQYSVAFGEQGSTYKDTNRPANREWHEFAHHFLADAFGGFMPSHAGRQNHQGYYVNTRSTDAWTEGFAEFFAMMVGRQIIGDPKFMEYKYDGTAANLEADYEAWADEEFATAGLLLDLVDDGDDYASAKDDDQISIPVEDVWTMISKGVSLESDGNGHIFDMVDLYNNLSAYSVGAEDLDQNKRADLNDVFIAHGFFDDSDGNQQYRSGDRTGYTSHPSMSDRRDKPGLPGAYLAYTATNNSGIAVAGTAFKVDVLFDPPHDYLSVSYTVPAEALRDGRLNIMLPPSKYSSHIRITAIADGYQESDPFEMTGADFWSKVPNPSDPPLATHAFTLKSKSSWMAPVLLIGTFGLCGLGGIFLVGLVLWRRKASAVFPGKATQRVGQRGENHWARVLLIALVSGTCCLVIAAGGLLIWRSNPLPVPPALPVNSQLAPSLTPAVALATSTQAFSATPSGSPSAAVLFQDDFSDPNSGWDDVRADEEANTYYFEDNYVVLINPAGFYTWANPYLNFTGDVQVEVDARQMTGSEYDEFGLLCRYAKNGDGTYSYYYFVIATDGLGVIYKVDHNEKSLIITDPPANRSDVIHSGDQVNHMRADCTGERLILYVNGELLVDAVDSAFGSGDVGLRADSESGGTEIRFDNFIVFKPDE